MVNGEWKGKLTRQQAIRLLEQITNNEDPYWSDVVEEYYDEETDTCPSIFHLYDALGITKEDYKEVFPGASIDDIWPKAQY